MTHLRNSLPLLAVLTTVLLAGCETPLQQARLNRFANTVQPLPVVEPSALALVLRVNDDGAGLAPASLRQLNTLLADQGRLNAQALSITPLTARGAQLAPRLAAALVAAGAAAPLQLPLTTDPARLADAAANDWDLEVQSEAMVVRAAPCAVARPQDWTVHPFAGVGQLGCANRANIAAMVSDVRDLRRPRTLAAADGRAAAGAVERYQTGDVRELIDINFNND